MGGGVCVYVCVRGEPRGADEYVLETRDSYFDHACMHAC